MVAVNKRENDKKLPCIGIWNNLQTCLPTAGNTLVGLWLDEAPRIEFFCAFYHSASGECVDPDEEEWGHITYHTRQGNDLSAWDEPIDEPDYWAECRFLIPDWR